MHDYLEDATKGQPIDPEKALTDDDLKAGGLQPVKSWIRTQAGANALKVKRYKDRQAAEGIKQINVQAPAGIKPLIQTLAKRIAQGESPQQVLADLAGSHPDPDPDPEVTRVRQVLHAGGWRAYLIRWLIVSRAR